MHPVMPLPASLRLVMPRDMPRHASSCLVMPRYASWNNLSNLLRRHALYVRCHNDEQNRQPHAAVHSLHQLGAVDDDT
eukprot:scaffold1082_cov100-Skeletonema_dohrnii-CCMP3373.AAC.1